jgi:hypothetical protein
MHLCAVQKNSYYGIKCRHVNTTFVWGQDFIISLVILFTLDCVQSFYQLTNFVLDIRHLFVILKKLVQASISKHGV